MQSSYKSIYYKVVKNESPAAEKQISTVSPYLYKIPKPLGKFCRRQKLRCI